MRMRYVPILLALVFLTLAGKAQAQATGYELQVYNAGAPAPLQTSPLALTDITCNLTPLTGTLNTVNPNRIIWDDPANTGRICMWTPPTSPTSILVSLPNGSYEGTVTVTDAAGTSPASNRAPFSRAPVPAARTGVKLYRAGS